MKFLIVLSVIAYVAADVSHLSGEASAPIVRSSYEISPEGAFQSIYETGNGIYSQAEGSLVNTNSEYPSLVMKGAYKYTAPDGTPIQVEYIADENGFQPQGAHLPTPPTIPEAIARSLQYIADHPPRVEGSVSAKAAASILG